MKQDVFFYVASVNQFHRNVVSPTPAPKFLQSKEKRKTGFVSVICYMSSLNQWIETPSLFSFAFIVVVSGKWGIWRIVYWGKKDNRLICNETGKEQGYQSSSLTVDNSHSLSLSLSLSLFFSLNISLIIYIYIMWERQWQRYTGSHLLISLCSLPFLFLLHDFFLSISTSFYVNCKSRIL